MLTYLHHVHQSQRPDLYTRNTVHILSETEANNAQTVCQASLFGAEARTGFQRDLHA